MKKKILSLLLSLVMLAAFVPVSVSAEVVASGTCGADGDNVTWVLDGTTLTISGSGAMANYVSNSNVPWYKKRTNIAKVEIAAGITNISRYAFYRCSKLENITIPEGVTSIGNYAFNGCSSLANITIPKGVTSIGISAFLQL